MLQHLALLVHLLQAVDHGVPDQSLDHIRGCIVVARLLRVDVLPQLLFEVRLLLLGGGGRRSSHSSGAFLRRHRFLGRCRPAASTSAVLLGNHTFKQTKLTTATRRIGQQRGRTLVQNSARGAREKLHCAKFKQRPRTHMFSWRDPSRSGCATCARGFAGCAPAPVTLPCYR